MLYQDKFYKVGNDYLRVVMKRNNFIHTSEWQQGTVWRH